MIDENKTRRIYFELIIEAKVMLVGGMIEAMAEEKATPRRLEREPQVHEPVAQGPSRAEDEIRAARGLSLKAGRA